MKPNIGSGDKGETSLIGKKVSKDECRVEAFGKIDELNSFIGLARATIEKDKDIDSLLEKIQKDLFVIGSDLATVISTKTNVPKISSDHVKFLENNISEFEKELKPLTKFILPTGNRTASLLHISRTICRSAERELVKLSKEEKINENIIPYVNRLSDLLFTLARVSNKRAGIEDKEWIRD